MSDIRKFNAQTNDGTDREHQVQLDLLQKLCQTIDTGTDDAGIGPLLTELIDYSEAHFMSEELLMRLKSYDDFESHLKDHVDMLDTLRAIAAGHAVGQTELIAGKAHEVLGFIQQHIATRDRHLADYVRTNQ